MGEVLRGIYCSETVVYIPRFYGPLCGHESGVSGKDAALPILGVLGGSRLEMLGGLGWSIDGCLPRGR